MGSQSEWLRDLGEAAEELGYGIEEISPKVIVLQRLSTNTRITIESYFLSGEFLRNVLVPVPKDDDK